VADLRARFIEDYAGGLLNVARQELSSTGEVLAQDGFPAEGTLFVEDGRGVKSGLRLGTALVESVDPVTETGVLNVRTADRTYAKIRDLKVFATAVASSQGALSESVAQALENLEQAFESLEGELERVGIDSERSVGEVDVRFGGVIRTVGERVDGIEERVEQLEVSRVEGERIVELELTTSPINDQASFDLDFNSPQYFGLMSIETDVPAWVTVYVDRSSRARDRRVSAEDAAQGVIADAVTSEGAFRANYLPVVVGYSADSVLRVRVVNQSGGRGKVNVRLRHIRL
jgi:hypothetical protein